MVAALLTGCGFSVGSVAAMPQERVERLTADQLEAAVGVRPDTVTCPGDLRAEVGETMRCELTAGPDTLGVELEVTEVEGDELAFDAVVDDQVS